MTFRTFTLDLIDRIEEIRERLDEIESEIDEIEEEVSRCMAAEDVQDPTEIDNWGTLSERDQELQAELTTLEGELKSFLDAVAHWQTDLDVTENPSHEEVREAVSEVDECLFEVEELSFGQVQSVQDDMMEESFEVDVQNEDIDGTPKQGYMEVELLREAIVDWPDGAPTTTVRYSSGERAEPGDYPEAVATWLFDKVDALNTVHEEEMGNSSLAERMR